MKIVIAGAGAVGTHLAHMLSKEDASVYLIDEDPRKTQAIKEEGSDDLMISNVSPSNLSALRELGVQNADLFIAVTPDETRNITCCALAHHLGARKTVARVDNAEYAEPQNEHFFNEMGIDSVIYPEMLAAKEILLSVQRSWVRTFREIHGGALILMGIKLRGGAQAIFDQPLRKLFPPESQYRIVAIKRGDTTIMPGGSDTLQMGDIAYFMTTRPYIQEIRRRVGKSVADYPDVHNVMIMGGGRIARHVAEHKPDNLHMKIIERDRQQCERLEEVLDDDIMVFCGDGRDTTLLRDEGIENYQAFVALTDSTETNILACLAAKQLGVKKTVALVENTDYVSLVSRLDIGTIINKKGIAASHIYRIMLDSRKANVSGLTIADAEIAEFEAAEGAPITQCPIRNLEMPRGVVLGGLIHDKKGKAITGDTIVEKGDIVVAFCKGALIKKIEPFFTEQRKGFFQKLF